MHPRLSALLQDVRTRSYDIDQLENLARAISSSQTAGENFQLAQELYGSTDSQIRTLAAFILLPSSRRSEGFKGFLNRQLAKDTAHPAAPEAGSRPPAQKPPKNGEARPPKAVPAYNGTLKAIKNWLDRDINREKN